ncbi:MAG: ABC transporter permease [Lachnospiraceae bacterium]|nr:ABC transporter permease [Lachnospiraceae bacterium]
MSPTKSSFLQMVKFIKRDKMLLATAIAPILAGLAIKFGIPLIEKGLVSLTGAREVLVPYYGIFDILLAALTPVMIGFVVAMIMLEERDDHIDKYLFVTGLGRKGYFLSRIGLPAGFALLVTLILLPLFCITRLSIAEIALLAIVGTLQGILISLMVLTFSTNKLEGMAVTKLSSLIMMGCLIPFFVPTPLRYVFTFMPSYWTGAGIAEGNALLMLPGVGIAALWILILYKVKD